MRESFGSVLPEIDPVHQDHRRRRPHAPAVERIAGWSARHRKTAVFGWLLLIAAVFAVGQLMGSRNLPSSTPVRPGRRNVPCTGSLRLSTAPPPKRS